MRQAHDAIKDVSIELLNRVARNRSLDPRFPCSIEQGVNIIKALNLSNKVPKIVEKSRHFLVGKV